MYPNKISQTLIDAVTPVALTSSTDATPIVVTATAHGLVTGDRVLIYGHTTNVAANGIFLVTKLTANTFSLQDEFLNTDVVGSGAGGGGASGFCMKAPAIALMSDFKNAELQVGTTGTSTLILKIAGSLGMKSSGSQTARQGLPNFGATVSPTNPYSFLQVVDLDTGAAINGATGIVASGADVNKQYEVNINAMRWLTVIPTSWTQGAITVKLMLTTAV